LDGFTAISFLEMRSYMVNTLLRDTDAVSMSHSLEVRVPLLDHRLVEFVAGLPPSLKHRRGRPKTLLVEALQGLLPDEVVRQPKRTFTFPWERWLRGPLAPRMEAGLADLSPALQPFLDGGALRGVWQDFLAGRTSWSRPWSLYVLNEWVRRNLTGATLEVDPLSTARAMEQATALAAAGPPRFAD
jgi:asparagine synthase (glutamine-hydrolysing)